MNDWTIRLADQAVQDVEDILDWTLEQFGPMQLEVYTDTISDALEALSQWPQLTDAHWRSELGDDVATLHLARQGRKARHLLVFRVHDPECVIDVLRVLHDSMELQRHLDS